MGEPNSKHLKSLHKDSILQVLLWVPLMLAGCATLVPPSEKLANDASRNLGGVAQANWEKNGVEASAEYHFTLAQAYSHEGKVDRAIEEYRAALAHDPVSPLLHAKLAAEYLKKGSVTFAIEECNRSLEKDPHSIDVRLMLGGIYSLNNELDLALQEYEKVLKLDPENDEAAVFKTQILSEKEKFGEALQFIRKFTGKVKDSAAAWFYLGKLELNKNRMNESIRAFRKALEVRPGFSQASLALGLLFEAHSENSKAIQIYSEQMEEKPDLQVAGRLVTLYLKENQSEKALKLLQSMAALDPDDLNTQLRMGLVNMQKGNWTEARILFEALLQKVPDSDKVNYYLGAIYEQEGKFDLTIRHLKMVSAQSKLFEDATLHAVGLLRKKEDSREAFSILENAIKLSPENPGFYLVMASMFEDEKRNPEATKVLADGLRWFPDHEKMRYFYGALLEKIGESDAAVSQMEKILEKSPNHADALNFVAYSWTTQGVHLKDAEDMLKRAMKLKPNNPFILDSFGWNQFVLGKKENALIYLEKAAGLKGDEETILLHLVEVYSKNQMPDRARETRVRIESLQSRDPGRAPASVEQK